MKKFPQTIYVRREGDEGEDYLVANETEIDAVDGDGPTVVAEYELSGTAKLRKVVEELK